VLRSGWVSFPTSCLLDFYGAGGDNEGRGTDSPGGRYPNRTNGAPTPTTPQITNVGIKEFVNPIMKQQLWYLWSTIIKVAGSKDTKMHRPK